MSGSLKPRGGGGLQIELKKNYLFFLLSVKTVSWLPRYFRITTSIYRLSNIETGESVKKIKNSIYHDNLIQTGCSV